MCPRDVKATRRNARNLVILVLSGIAFAACGDSTPAAKGHGDAQAGADGQDAAAGAGGAAGGAGHDAATDSPADVQGLDVASDPATASDAPDAPSAFDGGASDATLDVASDATATGPTDGPVDVPADVPSDVAPPAPQTTIPTAAIDFGAVACGSAGGGMPLEFMNTGTASLHYRAVIAPGGIYALMGAAADGSVSADVAPNGSAMLVIVAGTISTTTAAGASFPGSLAIVTNAAGAQSVQVPLEMTSTGATCTLDCSGFTKCTPTTGSPYCANTATDNTNCGACGHACGTGEVCSGDACALSCGALTTCTPTGSAPYCANTTTDNANCGTCGHVCGAGEACMGSACVLTCGALTTCTPTSTSGAPYCANTGTDSANCGTCGHVCGTGEICMGNACVLSCGALTKCTPTTGAPYCANTSTDNADCGTCGHACGMGQACITGTCQNTCSASQTLCDGACTSTSFDPANCGTCDHACSFVNGAAACASGACALASCTTGFADCDRDPSDGCEINKLTDAANCGACGFSCALGETCSAGTCSADLSQGLIGYWKFDDAVGSAAAADSAANHLNGQVQGNVTFVPGGGKQGSGAAMFGGAGSVHVVFPNDAKGDGTGVFIPQGNITFSMWFKTTSANVGGLQVVEGGEWSAGCDRVIGNGAGDTLQFGTWNENDMSEPFIVNDGVWHQVVYVLDKSSGFKAYIDGVLEMSSAAATNCGVGCSGFNWASEYWIGTGAGCRYTANGFTGLIDDVRIYDYALPATTVTLLFNGSK
jgi:hypothetical protein